MQGLIQLCRKIQNILYCTVLGWAGLYWAVLGWAGLGWAVI